jgi:hypothetical protein
MPRRRGTLLLIAFLAAIIAGGGGGVAAPWLRSTEDPRSPTASVQVRTATTGSSIGGRRME